MGNTIHDRWKEWIANIWYYDPDNRGDPSLEVSCEFIGNVTELVGDTNPRTDMIGNNALTNVGCSFLAIADPHAAISLSQAIG